ncbi:MAG: O-antigen ligase family protein [Saprospiraceae bacterium]|nr:O-antigen ligase family protein [Saprospiraceae bacterium]
MSAFIQHIQDIGMSILDRFRQIWIWTRILLLAYFKYLRIQLLQQKMNNPLGIGILLIIALIVSGSMALLGLKLSAALLGLTLAIPFVILSSLYLRIGVLLTLCIAYFFGLIMKYTSAPIGTAVDALFFLLGLSMMVAYAKKRDWTFPRNGISIWVIIWVSYNFLMVLNPIAPSKMAWVFTVRSLAVLHIFYFIVHYALENRKQVFWMLKCLIGLAFLAALYGIKQEFIGYSAQEWAWLYENPKRYQLIVQWNRFRAFSFFSDPTTFGTLMAYMGTFSLILATAPFVWWKRAALIGMGLMMFLSMAYAGSRTPFLLVPIAGVFYVMINPKKEVLIIASLMALLGTAFVMKSTSNAIIYRIQSAFNPAKDASVQVRMENQKLIQPFIQTHPFGAGLGSTGIWGERFSPDSWLAGFAHDSGFVRIAVEMGWLGLLLYMGLLFAALRMALFYYLRVRDPIIRVVYQALTVVVFMLALACYPQEITTLLPTSIIFYIFLAIIARLKDFDEEGYLDQ